MIHAYIAAHGPSYVPPIEIEQEEYDKLKYDQGLLRALQAAGVENWEGYEQALISMA